MDVSNGANYYYKFISDMKVLSLVFFTYCILFTAAVLGGPIDYPAILKSVVMALNGLDDETIKSYGIDPGMLKFRDELNSVIPQDLTKTIRVL